MKLTRARLRPDKGLIGFVGGPFTLYVYAAAGSHENARQALPGLARRPVRRLQRPAARPARRNMAIRRAPAPRIVAVLDTAAGEVDAGLFASRIVPVLAELLRGSAGSMRTRR